jgi:DNA-binding transcriptional ArsR family regulator
VNPRPKSNAPPSSTSHPRRRKVTARRSPSTPPEAVAIADDELEAAVEAELAEQRAAIKAKLLARREAERAAEEKRQAEIERARADAAQREQLALLANTELAQMAQLRALLEKVGVELKPLASASAPALTRVDVPADMPDTLNVSDVPDNDYSDTERVQIELNALLDLLGVVRVKDVQEHVRREDGAVMSPSNVRYHMKKLANRGIVKKVEERYQVPGLGWRTRDVWSKDPQKLLEVLEGKKIVRS